MIDTQPDPDADHIQPFDTTTQPIHVLLARVAAEVPFLGKDSKVTSGPAKFAYRGVDDVMNAVGPALRKHGVVMMPNLISHEPSDYKTSGGKTARDVVVVVRFDFWGPRGDCVSATLAGEASSNDDKATSQAHSVALRTALLQVLCIPTGDPDPDETSITRGEQAQQQPAPGPEVDPAVLAEQQAKDEQAKTKGFTDHAQRLRLWAKLSDRSDTLTDEQAQAIMAWMAKAEVTPGTFSMKLAEQWKAALDEIATTQPTD